MKPYWQILGDKDRDAIRTLMVFLNGRLAERSTIEWALGTTRDEVVKRTAILQALEFVDAQALKEPWRTAWRLIEESWDDDDVEASSIEAYRAQRRIVAGERTGAVISSIVSFVRPRLQVEAKSDRQVPSRRRPPRRVEDFFRASLTSHELVDIDVYHLEDINEVDFLVALATELEGAVNRGTSVGRRLGWNNDYKFWMLGQLDSISYERRDDDGYHRDIDQFHRGIAPSVKLLSAVIGRLSAIDVSEAIRFVTRWKQAPTPLHLRLWASLSLNPLLTSPEDLSATLPSLDDRSFWDVHSFPEIAVLRACRFGELSDAAIKKIELRIKKGPPKNFWPKDSDRDRVRSARVYWSAREYRRIEVAGNKLSNAASHWLIQHLDQFSDLRDMNSIRYGFPQTGLATRVRPQPNARFNELQGIVRLHALEAALATAPKGWDDDPSERASDWIQEGDHSVEIVADLESVPNGGALYPNTWDRLGWSLKAPDRNSAPTGENLQVGNRVLRLLLQLPDEALLAGIQGISYWFSAWAKVLSQSAELARAWTKLWPLAVEATNVASVDPEGVDLNEIVAPTPGQEPDDLDTLNVPVGRLIDVFLALCPKIEGNENPFDRNELLCTMRDLIISAEGKAGLIGRHRLVEELPYFLSADEQWTRENLIAPLNSEDDRALALWRAIARRTQFKKVLEIIGDQVATWAVDRRLGRDRRGVLVSSLVIEALHSFREKRSPVVPNRKIQQTLRAMDDEVRATAAQTIRRYLSEMAEIVVDGQKQPAEEIFRTAVAPFLEQVWPQERSLATRGVSAAFAALPVAAGQAFVEAVDAIDRFLVPFDCWSMSDFDLWGESEGTPRLALIDTPAKAAAFLRLLDLTIGTSEGAVVPMDLAQALEQIQMISQELVQNPAFRRLATMARRR
jgi:hypothetical protein